MTELRSCPDHQTIYMLTHDILGVQERSLRARECAVIQAHSSRVLPSRAELHLIGKQDELQGLELRLTNYARLQRAAGGAWK